MARRYVGERVWGPYRRRDGRWQIEHRTGQGKGGRVVSVFPTKDDAEKVAGELRALIVPAASSFTVAIQAYEKHLVQKGNKPVSYKETLRRLRLFFDGVMEVRLDLLTQPRAQRIYDSMTGKYSADTHRNILLEARSFMRWCLSKKWITGNPLDGIQGVGKRKHGKAQLRVDEARRWAMKALALAEREDGAVAAILTGWMGLRASEVCKRRVRDLDDNGRLLWIEDTKTEAGRRTLEVPPFLRPHLRRLAGLLPAGRDGMEPLFPADRSSSGFHDRGWPCDWVQRICIAAELPEVTAHGMRGLHATLGAIGWSGLDATAARLGHEDASTTERSYASREAVASARHRGAVDLLGIDSADG